MRKEVGFQNLVLGKDRVGTNFLSIFTNAHLFHFQPQNS